MATMAKDVLQPKIRRRKQAPNLVVIHGGRELEREEGKALSLTVSDRFRARQAERLQQRVARYSDAPDRRSVALAMLSVEIELVKAFWTIARQPLGSAAPIAARRCGLDYTHERTDTHARYTDAPSGKWEAIAPRPSPPSSKDIDAANAAIEWLLLIGDERLRRLLVVGATSKRGDVGRRIAWTRIRPSLKHYADMTVRTMQRKYGEALRIIVTELTIARMSSLSHKGI